MSEDKVKITNYMEILVYEFIDKVVEEMDLCRCERCRMDIAALSLNSLTPKYVVSYDEILYAKINLLYQQFEVDIMTAVSKAAISIKENPRHEL